MYPKFYRLLLLALTTLLAAAGVGACRANNEIAQVETVKEDKRSEPMSITLTSPSFEEGQPIPARHTCDGDNLSPPLNWDRVPDQTKSFVLICDDPDAPSGIWVHWIIFDLPAKLRKLPEGVKPDPVAIDGTTQGQNDFKDIGYGGPCPPKGAPHRYFFKLYALDNVLQLQPAARKEDVEKAMKGHILAEAKLMGTYKRK